eukprot:2234222-Prymnesium_polylepis.1
MWNRVARLLRLLHPNIHVTEHLVVIELKQSLKVIFGRRGQLAPFVASESMIWLTFGNSDRTSDQFRQTLVELIERGPFGRRATIVKVETDAVVLLKFRQDTVTFEQYGTLNSTHIILLELHAKVGRGHAHMFATEAQRIGECDIRVKLECNDCRSMAHRDTQVVQRFLYCPSILAIAIQNEDVLSFESTRTN